MNKTLWFVIVGSALLLSAAASFGQTAGAGDEVKTISSPGPEFPAKAADPIYGDSIRVAVNVDKTGKVIEAIAFGPLAPCFYLKDPVAEEIREAALKAAKATVFEPILTDGKPVEKGLIMTYYFRPRTALGPADKTAAVETAKTVRGGVLNGKALSLPKPKYPRAAYGIAGMVQVSVLIAEDGKMLSAGPFSGNPVFYESSIRAACGARYSPTTLAGHPVKVMGLITYNFIP